MKKLIAIALSILPLVSDAQSIDLGINAGAGIQEQMTSGGFGSARLNIHLSRWFMIGGAIDMGNMTQRHEIDFVGQSVAQRVIKMTYVNPNVSLNAKFNIARSYIYAGINGGYIAVKANEYMRPYESSPVFSPASRTINSGFTMGTQVGFTNHITGKWSFNVEGGARIMTFSENSPNRFLHNSHLYYPVSIGLRYSM